MSILYQMITKGKMFWSFIQFSLLIFLVKLMFKQFVYRYWGFKQLNDIIVEVNLLIVALLSS